MMQADPGWQFIHTLALARGMSIEEVEDLPYNEVVAWAEYDAIRPLDPWVRQAVLCSAFHATITGKHIDPHKFLPGFSDEIMNPPQTEEEAIEREMADYQRMVASFNAVAMAKNRT